jgi:hypothetical protein
VADAPLIVTKRARHRLADDVAYFNADYMGDPESAFVCWLDVMGVSARMNWSVAVAANGVCKLYNAVIRAYQDSDRQNDVHIYPAMDGAYLATTSWETMLQVLRTSMRRLANTFMTCPPHFRFPVRGGISHGSIYHGENIQEKADRYLSRMRRVRDCLVFGTPVISAYRAERRAAPFGIFLDESALGRTGITGIDQHLDWPRLLAPQTNRGQLLAAIVEYYDSLDALGDSAEYPQSQRRRDLRRAEAIFG